MAEQTLTYSDDSKGWTAFHSFIPDWMAKLNNRFYTIKNGQLYLHNDESNPIRNNFYGTQYGSKIQTVINVDNSEDKIFKTLIIEGNKPWKATLKTNLAESTIATTEFKSKESRHFAYVRRTEDATDLHGNTAQGIGVIVSATGLTVTYASISPMVNIGDALYQLNGSVHELIGTIALITATTITVTAITTTPTVGLFCFSKKNSRIEGADMRGYFADITLENDDTSSVELYAVESNVIKSYV